MICIERTIFLQVIIFISLCFILSHQFRNSSCIDLKCVLSIWVMFIRKFSYMQAYLTHAGQMIHIVDMSQILWNCIFKKHTTETHFRNVVTLHGFQRNINRIIIWKWSENKFIWKLIQIHSFRRMSVRIYGLVHCTLYLFAYKSKYYG